MVISRFANVLRRFAHEIKRVLHMYLPPGGGFSPIKVTGVLVVPFRGLNLWIVPLGFLKPKMTAARVDTLLGG